MEQRTFKSCRFLKSIKLPEHLEYIGEECFSGCGLETVSLPPGIVELRTHVFYNNKLSQVTFCYGSRLAMVDDYALGRNSQLRRREVEFPQTARVSGKAFKLAPEDRDIHEPQVESDGEA